MRLITFLVVVALAGPSSVRSQSLDIGGIEIHLGQDLPSTLSKLQSAYDVKYEDALKLWSVSKKRTGNDPYNVIGRVGVTGETVSLVERIYDLGDVYDLQNVYSVAMLETRKRGGTSCHTSPYGPSSALYWRIDTVCGQYMVSLILPGKDKALASANDSEGRFGAGVTIMLQRKP
jgi:hypothetical protein